MPHATPDDIRRYVSEFRKSFIAGARFRFSIDERGLLGLLPYLSNFPCIGASRRRYMAAGYMLRPSGQDRIVSC